MFNFIFSHTTRQSSATATSHRSTFAIYSSATSNCTLDIPQHQQCSPELYDMHHRDLHYDTFPSTTTQLVMGREPILLLLTPMAPPPYYLAGSEILCYIPIPSTKGLEWLPSARQVEYRHRRQLTQSHHSVKHAC